jgi:LacI family transcriptional regulator
LQHIIARLPVVAMSGATLNDDLSRITVDNAGGIRELIEHLVRAHGLRTLQFVGPTFDADRMERYESFRATLRAAKLPVPRKALAPTGDYQTMLTDLLGRNALPDAFVCVNDEVALALTQALRDADIDVPGRVAVTGFDGIVAGRLISPALTTVRQPMATMGALAVQILIDHIEHPDRPKTLRQLPVQLMLHESCGCAPKGTADVTPISARRRIETAEVPASAG